MRPTDLRATLRTMFGAAPLLRTSTLLLASLCCGLAAQDGPATPALDGMIEQKDGRFAGRRRFAEARETRSRTRRGRFATCA